MDASPFPPQPLESRATREEQDRDSVDLGQLVTLPHAVAVLLGPWHGGDRDRP